MTDERDSQIFYDDEELKNMSEMEWSRKYIMQSLEQFVANPHGIRPIDDLLSVYNSSYLVDDPFEPSQKMEIPTLKRKLINVTQGEFDTVVRVYKDEIESCSIDNPFDYLKDEVGPGKLTTFNMKMRIVHGGNLTVRVFRNYKTNKIIEAKYDLLAIGELNKIPLKEFNIENISMFEALQHLIEVPFDGEEPNYPN